MNQYLFSTDVITYLLQKTNLETLIIMEEETEIVKMDNGEFFGWLVEGGLLVNSKNFISSNKSETLKITLHLSW